EIDPHAITIAEDVSGMPGLGAKPAEGGCGFDFRLAMGVPDHWFKLVNDTRDEDWHLGTLWHQLVDRRQDERTISYVESHDQSIVGGKTLIFEMADAAMYEHMRRDDQHPSVDRAIALFKMARLATLATAGHGYLNFIGNEFGHPEWVDFPREGNNWSYHHARRQWSLRDHPELKYSQLAAFDEACLTLIKEYHCFDHGPWQRYLHEDDKILVFSRGDLWFFFNFHPEQSHPDYPIPVDAGSYHLVLDCDHASYAGHGRLQPDQSFVAALNDDDVSHLKVYLPNRSALVLRKQP
ncbi:MAG: alpha amylase C-terminal domain-containing protein, partial [Verrucomicrobiota bacterium]